MLQLVEPPKIPRLVRSQAILREDGGHSGGRRVVKLVELSKKAGDSGAQALLQEGTELATPESEEEAVNLVATKNPMVRHSEGCRGGTACEKQVEDGSYVEVQVGLGLGR